MRIVFSAHTKRQKLDIECDHRQDADLRRRVQNYLNVLQKMNKLKIIARVYILMQIRGEYNYVNDTAPDFIYFHIFSHRVICKLLQWVLSIFSNVLDKDFLLLKFLKKLNFLLKIILQVSPSLHWHRPLYQFAWDENCTRS